MRGPSIAAASIECIATDSSSGGGGGGACRETILRLRKSYRHPLELHRAR